ncbi:hypothetical protein AX16_002529 [Volvariella volvacea WC 439]|nr:hypothetical protein AX16_002529 [Volvariella volvacea WC 439]
MSTSRVADAATITAYTVYPDDAYGDIDHPDYSRPRHGSLSASATLKGKSRLRDDRPEEERFNVAVTSNAFRSRSRPVRHRAPRSERREERPSDDATPCFPPPSFQEAVSATDSYITAPSVAQRSTTDLLSTANGDIETTQQQPSPRIQFPTHSSRPSVSGSDSDGSLVNLDHELPIIPQTTWTPDQKVSARRAPQSQTAPATTAASTTSTHHDCTCASSSAPGAQPSIQTPSRDAPRPSPPSPSPTASTKRRHLSLAPLRTLFPIGSHDRRHSAHASPTTGHKFASGLFKKDSPSLIPTPLKLYEQHPPAPSPTHHDNFLTRKIFGQKVKNWSEELKHYSSGEVKFAQIDDQWEALVIEQDDFSSSGSSRLSSPSQLTLSTSCPQHSPPPSRTTFSQVASLHSPPPSAQAPAPSVSSVSSPPSSPPPVTPPEVPPNPHAPHPLSLRDQKIKPQPLIQRQPQPRREPSPPAFTESPPPPPPPPPPPLALQQPHTPQPKTPPRPTMHVKSRSHVIAASPLAEAWRPDDDDDIDTHNPALSVPLVPTPIEPLIPEPKSSTPSVHRRLDEKKLLAYYDSTSVKSGSIRSQATTVKRPSEKFLPETESDYHSARSHKNEVYSSWQAHKSTVSLFSTDETSSRRHYPGRPLPNPPPQVRARIASTLNAYEEIKAELAKAKKGSAAQADIEKSPPTPEVKLIDFDDPPTPPPSPSPPPPIIDDWSSARKRLTSKSAVTLPGELLSSGRDDPDVSWRSSPPLPRSYVPPSYSPPEPVPVTPPPVPRLPKVSRTDRQESFMELQAYIAHFNDVTARNRLEGERQPRTPQRPTRPLGDVIESPPASPVVDRFMDGIDKRSSIVGIVELERRRTLKDGRVKLKLSLYDVSVDKCALCRKQFKDGERAEMNAKCKHAFHQDCLRKLFPQGMGACPIEHPPR